MFLNAAPLRLIYKSPDAHANCHFSFANLFSPLQALDPLLLIRRSFYSKPRATAKSWVLSDDLLSHASSSPASLRRLYLLCLGGFPNSLLTSYFVSAYVQGRNSTRTCISKSLIETWRIIKGNFLKRFKSVSTRGFFHLELEDCHRTVACKRCPHREQSLE